MTAEQFYLDGTPAPAAPTAVPPRRRTDYTAQAAALLERGRHPATRLAVRTDLGTCAGCAHHITVHRGATRAHKCVQHRLGLSHSEASDIRTSWPACQAFTTKATS